MGHRDTKQVLRRNKMELKDFTINNIIELVCTQPVEKTTEGNNLFQILNENTAYNVDVLFQKTSEDKDCLAILAVYYSEKKEKIKISIQTETIGNAKEALVAWFYNNINNYTNTMEELKNVSSMVQTPAQDARKPYEAPSAEIILLAPKEELAGWDYQYHKDSDADRGALDGWGYDALRDSKASGVYGTVKPNNWTLPTE